MSVSILRYGVSLPTILRSNTTSLAKTKSHALTLPFVTGFEEFQVKLLAVHTGEIDLRIAVYAAAARVSVANEEVNDCIDTVCRVTLNTTKGNRTAQLYMLLFDGKHPASIKKLACSTKQKKLLDWVALLEVSPITSLSALVPMVEASAAEADAAIKALAEAKRKSKEFRKVGPRKALIDEFNALRKAAYGSISELPHKHPEMNLPGSFAERFFQHEKKKRKESEEVRTAETLSALIAEQEEALSELRRELEEKLAEEANGAKVKSQAEVAETELASAEKAAEAAAAKLAALKAKLAES